MKTKPGFKHLVLVRLIAGLGVCILASAQAEDKKTSATAHVRLEMQQIRERSPILREMIDQGLVGLVGGMYDLSTGQTHFFDK